MNALIYLKLKHFYCLLGDECEAHLWTSDVVGKYIAIAIELPQYRSAAHINSVNGAKFITLLHEDDVKEAFSLNCVVTNPLHVYKILSFSSNLREKILNNAVEKLPTHFHVWSCAHLAGWLEYAHKVPSCAIEVLKRRICGNDIIFKTVVELGKLFQLCDSDESSIAIDAL